VFINQPEFYYNRFVIRDGNGQWVRDVSLKAGFWSYITAALGVGFFGGGVTGIIVARRRPVR
jgi:hypothetical protein